MLKKRNKHTTSEQFALLLQELRRCPEMAKSSNRNQWDQEWEKIRVKLNSRGPPIRSTTDWKRVWLDLKGRTNRKLKDNVEVVQKTGIGPFCKAFLTSAEQDVVEIINMAKNSSPNIQGRVHGVVDKEDIRDEGDMTEPHFEDPLHLPQIASTSVSPDHNEPSLFAFPPPTSVCTAVPTFTATVSTSTSSSASTFSSDSTAADSATLRAPKPKRRKGDDECVKLFPRKAMDRFANSQQNICNTLDRIANNQQNICNTLDRIANNQQNICNTLDRIANNQQNIVNTLDRMANTLEMFFTDPRRREASEAKINLR